MVTELVLGSRVGNVDLVPEHQEGNVNESLVGKQRIQLLLGLQEPVPVGCVNDVDNRIHLQDSTIVTTIERREQCRGSKSGALKLLGYHMHI